MKPEAMIAISRTSAETNVPVEVPQFMRSPRAVKPLATRVATKVHVDQPYLSRGVSKDRTAKTIVDTLAVVSRPENDERFVSFLVRQAVSNEQLRQTYLRPGTAVEKTFDKPRLKFLHAVAVAPTDALHWAEVCEKISEWSSLQEDWDDNGAMPIDSVILRAADKFMIECETRTVKQPRPYISSDGEIGFHWKGELRASISFLSESNRFLAYVERSDAEPVRIGGPLDIATSSNIMFEALAALA